MPAFEGFREGCGLWTVFSRTESILAFLKKRLKHGGHLPIKFGSAKFPQDGVSLFGPSKQITKNKNKEVLWQS